MDLEALSSRRRTVIVGAGLGAVTAALAACATDGKPAAGSSSSAPVPPSGSSAAPTTLAKTADVPVGGGVIVGDFVVTQPTAGVFKGLSSVCTHAGCNLSAIVDGKLDCPCHGSKFNLDGTVAQGPATTPLESKAITVQGNSIVAG